MKLSPREKDKLLVSMAAVVAQKRKERGVKLNYLKLSLLSQTLSLKEREMVDRLQI